MAASLPLTLIWVAVLLMVEDRLVVSGGGGRYRVTADASLVVLWLAMSAAYIFAVSVTLLAACDHRLGRPLRAGDYVLTVARRAVPLTACSLLVWICVTLGLVALIVPGLWLYALWSLILPAILVESLGFAALDRSAELTRGYRWPVLGTLFVLAACSLGMSTALGYLAGAASSFVPNTALVLKALTPLASAGVLFVGTALLYLRLREIKEGTGTESVAQVFA